MATEFQNPFGLSGPYPKLKKSSSANRLFQIQKQNAKNLRTLKSLGIDTSKVTDDKQNPLFSALEELDQIIGTQGSVEFFSRLAETKTKGGKPWQKGEKEELLAGGVLPWALIGAGTLVGTVLGGVGGAAAGGVGAVPGAAAGGVGGAKLAASLLGAAGLATAGYSYAKGQLGLNKYLDYRGSEEHNLRQFIGTESSTKKLGRKQDAMSTALWKFIDQELGTDMADNPAANIALGLPAVILMDNLRVSMGTKAGTKAAIGTEIKKMFSPNIGIMPDVLKSAGIPLSRVIPLVSRETAERLSTLEKLDLQTFGKTAVQLAEDGIPAAGVTIGELKDTVEGQRLLNEVYLGVRHATMSRLKDYGGVKLISRHGPTITGQHAQRLYDEIYEAAKWSALRSDTFGSYLKRFREGRMGKFDTKALEAEKQIVGLVGEEALKEYTRTGEPAIGTIQEFIRSNFGAGSFGELYARSGSTIEDIAIKEIARNTSSLLTQAAHLGTDEFKKIRNMIPDTENRHIAAMLIAYNYGDIQDPKFQQLLSKLDEIKSLDAKVKSLADEFGFDIINGKRDPDMSSVVRFEARAGDAAAAKARRVEFEMANQRLGKAIGEAKKLKVELLAKAKSEQFVENALRRAGIEDEATIQNMIEAMEYFRTRMAKALRTELDHGYINRDLLGFSGVEELSSLGYVPGVLPISMTAQDEAAQMAAYGRLQEALGLPDVDWDNLKGKLKTTGRQFMYSKDEYAKSKKFLTITDKLGAGFATETDLAKLAAHRTMKAHNRAALSEFKLSMLLTLGRPIYVETATTARAAEDLMKMSEEQLLKMDDNRAMIISLVSNIMSEPSNQNRIGPMRWLVSQMVSKAGDPQGRQLLADEMTMLDELALQFPEFLNESEFKLLRAIYGVLIDPKQFAQSDAMNRFLDVVPLTDEQLKAPGVYIFKDGNGNILYVGKSKNIAKRLNSYASKVRSGELVVADINARAAADFLILSANEVRNRMLRRAGITDLTKIDDMNPAVLEVDAMLYQLLAPSVARIQNKSIRDDIYKVLNWANRRVSKLKETKTYITGGRGEIVATNVDRKLIEESQKQAAERLAQQVYSADEVEAFVNAIKSLVTNDGVHDAKNVSPIVYVLNILNKSKDTIGKQALAKKLRQALKDHVNEIVGSGVDTSSWQYAVINDILFLLSGETKNAEVILESGAWRGIARALHEGRVNIETLGDNGPEVFNYLLNSIINTTVPKSKRPALREGVMNMLGIGPESIKLASPINADIRKTLPGSVLSWTPKGSPNKLGLKATAFGGEMFDEATGNVITHEWKIVKQHDGYSIWLTITSENPQTKLKTTIEEMITPFALGSENEAKEVAQELLHNQMYYDELGLDYAASAFDRYAELGTTSFDPMYESRVNAWENVARKENDSIVGKTSGGSSITLNELRKHVTDAALNKDDGIVRVVTTDASDKSDMYEILKAKLASIEVSKEAEPIVKELLDKMRFYDAVNDLLRSRPITQPFKSYDEFMDAVVDIAKQLTRADGTFRLTDDMLMDMGNWVNLTHRSIPRSRAAYVSALKAQYDAQIKLRGIELDSLLPASKTGARSDMIQDIISWSENNGISKAEQNGIARYLKWLTDERRPFDTWEHLFDETNLNDYARYLIEEMGNSPDTAKKTYTTLSKLAVSMKQERLASGGSWSKKLQKLYEDFRGEPYDPARADVIGTHEAMILTGKENYNLTDDIVEELTEEEIEEYYRWRDYITFLILYRTGMRQGEFAQFSWDTLANPELFIPIAKKNGRPNFKWPPDVVQDLTRFSKKYSKVRDQIPFPFMSRRGEGFRKWVTTDDLSKNKDMDSAMRARARELGTYEATSHTMRRAVATHMYESGVPEETIRDFLNHKNIETTRAYIHDRLIPMSRSGDGNSLGLEAFYNFSKRNLGDRYEDIYEDDFLKRFASSRRADARDSNKVIYDMRWSDEVPLPENVANAYKTAPEVPGIIEARNSAGELIYAVYAHDMRARVEQLVGGGDRRVMVPKLLSEVADFTYRPTETEEVARRLELEMIRKYRPYYNFGTPDGFYQSRVAEKSAKTTPVDELLGATVKPAEEDAGRQFRSMFPEIENLRRDGLTLAKAMVNLKPHETVASVVVGNKKIYFAVDRVVAGFFDKFLQERFVDDEGIKQFLRFYDAALTLWKRQATILRVGFHARNKLSNAFLMWIHGFFNPHMWMIAPHVLRGGEGTINFEGNEEIMRIFNKTELTYDEIVELAKQQRVRVGYLESAQIAGRSLGEISSLERETGKNLFETIGYGVGLNPFAPGSKISKGMQYIGTEWVEDADRLATFMTALQRGFTPSEAGMLVDKILYDYSPLGLSMLESSVLKRIFPFYTWMKRNTPTMFKLLVTEPLVFQNLKRLSEGTFEAYGLDRSIMPDYLAQAAPVFALPIEDNDGNKVVLNLGIPIADVNRALEPSEIFSSMAPGIKWMMEYPQNYDLYYDKPIAATPGQKKRVPTMIYPVDFALSNKLTGPAWDAMLKHLGIVEQTDKFTGKKYLAGDAYAIKVMKDFMPLLNTLSKMGVDPLETGSQSAADFFGEIAGVKATPYDVDALTRYHEYEKFGQLQELIGQAKANQLIPESTGKKKKPQSVEEVLGLGRSKQPTR